MAQSSIPSTRQRVYKDFSLGLTKNPVTNDIVFVTGPDAVKRAIKTLLLTEPGEVPFLPNFGCRLTALMFEPIDAITTAQITNEIQTTIEAYEPRAKIESLVVTPKVDESAYQVDLTISLINLLEPITLTVFLSRLR